MNKITIKTKQMLTQKEQNTNGIEEIEKRTIYTKSFINENGIHTLEISGKPIHYLNNATHFYEEIDNSLIERDNSFHFKCDKLNIFFSKEIASDTPLLNIDNNGHSLKMTYKGKVEKNGSKKLRKVYAQSKVSNQVFYDQIADNIRLEYKVEVNRIKENIIINEPQESYEFDFKIDIGNLNVQLSKDEKSIELLDKQNKVQFIIPSPFMFDNNNQYSNNVSYEIMDEGDGTLDFKLIPDSNWMNSEERIFPITIDPEIIVQLEENEITKHFQITNNIANVTTKEGILDGTVENSAYLIAFNLEKLLNYNVTSAKLKFTSLFPFVSIVTIDVYVYLDANFNISCNDFIVESTNLRKIDSFRSSRTGSASYTFTSLFQLWREKKIIYNNVGTLLFKIQQSNSIYPFFLPTLIIEYTIPQLKPLDYINLNNPHIVESVYNVEVGIISNIKKLGVLTTFNDIANQKVFQQFQVDNLIYTRENITLEEWSDWRNQSLKAELIDGNLYLTD